MNLMTFSSECSLTIRLRGIPRTLEEKRRGKSGKGGMLSP